VVRLHFVHCLLAGVFSLYFVALPKMDGIPLCPLFALYVTGLAYIEANNNDKKNTSSKLKHAI